MRDAIEIAMGAPGLELVTERVRCDVLEVMGLIDDDVVGVGQQVAAATGVVEEERVVDDDDARHGRGAPGALEVAAAARGQAAPAGTGLIVGGDA